MCVYVCDHDPPLNGVSSPSHHAPSPCACRAGRGGVLPKWSAGPQCQHRGGACIPPSGTGCWGCACGGGHSTFSYRVEGGWMWGRHFAFRLVMVGVMVVKRGGLKASEGVHGVWVCVRASVRGVASADVPPPLTLAPPLLRVGVQDHGRGRGGQGLWRRGAEGGGDSAQGGGAGGVLAGLRGGVLAGTYEGRGLGGFRGGV